MAKPGRFSSATAGRGVDVLVLPAFLFREIMHSALSVLKDEAMNEIIEALKQFRDERDWKQFHNPKDLSLALSIEAGELLEAFLWKSPEAADMQKVEEELADVFAFAFLLADACQLDVEKIVRAKMEKNKAKYPVDKAKGSAKKYDEL
jgi:NTP pyrophosphatase (non-canonical NTP hydrolase)